MGLLHNDTLFDHCVRINKGELPYPNGCAKPISLKNDLFKFYDVHGKINDYIIITTRDGEIHYYKVTGH